MAYCDNLCCMKYLDPPFVSLFVAIQATMKAARTKTFGHNRSSEKLSIISFVNNAKKTCNINMMINITSNLLYNDTGKFRKNMGKAYQGYKPTDGNDFPSTLQPAANPLTQAVSKIYSSIIILI